MANNDQDVMSLINLIPAAIGIIGGEAAAGFEVSSQRIDQQQKQAREDQLRQQNMEQRRIERQEDLKNQASLIGVREGVAERSQEREFKQQAGLQGQRLGAQHQQNIVSNTQKLAADSAKLNQTLSKDLRDLWSGNDVTKRTRKVAGDFNKLQNTTDVTLKRPNAANSRALIINFYKMIDPGSVVREGEVDSVAKAGLDQRFPQFYSWLTSGAILSPAQVKQVQDTALSQYKGQIESQNRFNTGIKQLSEKQKVDPTAVVFEKFEAPRFSKLEIQKELDRRAANKLINKNKKVDK